MIDDMAALHETLDRRLRPEDVAGTILRAVGYRLDPATRWTLGRVSATAERRGGWFSLMGTEWERVVDASGALDYFARAVDGMGVPTHAAADNPVALLAACDLAWNRVKLVDRAHARTLGVSVHRLRRANRATRVLRDKAERMGRAQARRECAVASRVGLARTITVEEVRADPDAAAFVAYYVAKRNVRREFSLDDRDSPFDEVAQALFDRLGDDADWWMVARAYPTPDVLKRLTDQARGVMIGEWWGQMRRAAAICRAVDAASTVNRKTMIVHTGQDSSSWNLAAGAYNVARSGWLAALAASDGLGVLDAVCPPKLPRLMAADLAYWYGSAGRDAVHPDVRVAARLPWAWLVVEDGRRCDKAMVTTACQIEGVGPDGGWTAPFRYETVGTFTPTPDLVHGIVVGDPVLAQVLRRAGAWSSKGFRPGIINGPLTPPPVGG